MIKKIVDGTVYRLKNILGWLNKFFYKQPQILDIKSGLILIQKNRLSVSRFGDGEFDLIRGGKSLGFQEENQELSERLRKVLNEKVDGLEIGIPDVFGDLSSYTDKSAKFWRAYMGMHRGEMIHLLDINRKYLNTNMTRFWSGYKSKENVKEILTLYKKIWQDRNVIFVEGSLTRMGVGNDLFSNTASIKRILCPAKNAWNSYEKILTTILNLDLNKDVLFILALGPTASILACDLTKNGYQALDLGHLDIQYEYSLCNAKDKIAIEGKFVNENVEGDNVSDSIIDEKYKNSIIVNI